MQNISLKIKQFRKKNGISQYRMSKKIGISYKTLSAYETGRAVPSLRVMERINSAYSLNLISNQTSIEDRVNKILEDLQTLKKELSI